MLTIVEGYMQTKGSSTGWDNGIFRHIRVTPPFQRHDSIKEFASPLNDSICAFPTEFCGRGRRVIFRLSDSGGIKRIVKAAPARIGCIERVAGIVNRNDQLRCTDIGNLTINILHLHLERWTFFDQVADVSQESSVVTDTGFLAVV